MSSFIGHFLSIDIETEDKATLVLNQIIGLWLTVRGFSIAEKWMDQYLQISKQSTSKKRGLCTELKRAVDPTPENNIMYPIVLLLLVLFLAIQVKNKCLGFFCRGFNSSTASRLELIGLFPQLPLTGSNAADPCKRNEMVL